MYKQHNVQYTLWSLPYDTDSAFKPFLKVPFRHYLNNLISNQYFHEWEKAIFKQANNKNLWNQKCWRLLVFFQLLNQRFQLQTWDQNISFIQEDALRATLGNLRLWIDTQRLYLLSFLKLDSNEFQEDRIYMALFRTVTYLHALFSLYYSSDFNINFLNSFIKQAIQKLNNLSSLCTIDANVIIKAIIVLLQNVKKRETVILQPSQLTKIKRSAIVKVAKEAQLIKDVQNRLQNLNNFQKKIDQQLHLKMILKPTQLDKNLQNIRKTYDPRHVIRSQDNQQFFGSEQQKKRRKQQKALQKISIYQKQVLGQASNNDQRVYETLSKTKNNPYLLQNYQIYGQSVKVDMDNKSKYEKKKQAEVVSIQYHDRSKLYYQQSFLKQLEETDDNKGKVTKKDVNSVVKTRKKNRDFKNQDENTRIFNLKWHQDQNSNRRRAPSINNNEFKDYDNNLLFKSPLQQQILQSRKNNLDKLRQNMGTKSYTIALLENLGQDIHPEHIDSSFGATPFIKKKNQLLDIQSFKLLNQNKLDFMRKVIGYMTAQKKIKALIAQKNVPDTYPRCYADIKQNPYDPSITAKKYTLATDPYFNEAPYFI